MHRHHHEGYRTTSFKKRATATGSGTQQPMSSSRDSGIETLFDNHIFRRSSYLCFRTKFGSRENILRVRTGGHIAFAKYRGEGAAYCLLATSAVSQFLVTEKSEFVEKFKFSSSTMTEGGTLEKFYLPPFTLANVKQVSVVEWKGQRLTILPFTKKNVIESCVKVHGTGTPTEAETDSMISGNFNVKCSVFLGRYLTCVDDPCVIAYFLYANCESRPITPAERDEFVKERLRSVLLGVGCHPDNIILEWKNLGRRFPASLTQREERDFVDFMTVPTGRTVPTPWTVPQVLGNRHNIWNITWSSDLFQNLRREGRNGDRKCKIFTRKELYEPISCSFLFRDLSTLEGQDLFMSLQVAPLVTQLAANQSNTPSSSEYAGTFGPILDSQASPFWLSFNALCTTMFRPFVDPFWPEFCSPGTQRGPRFMADLRSVEDAVCSMHEQFLSFYDDDSD